MSWSFSDVLHCGIGRVNGSWFGVEVDIGDNSVYESQCEHAFVV